MTESMKWDWEGDRSRVMCSLKEAPWEMQSAESCDSSPFGMTGRSTLERCLARYGRQSLPRSSNRCRISQDETM